MPPSALINFLERVGRMLNRWNAQIRLDLWASIVLVCLAVLAFSDVSIQFERIGRIIAWLVLAALVGVTIQRLNNALNRQHTHEEVAVDIEHKFPQLDNHLINFLQFSYDVSNDPFKEMYVKKFVPHWDSLNLDEMKDRRRHLKAAAFLAASILLLVIPYPLMGRAWPVSVWRIVNPFSSTQPVSLTHILDVMPGDASVLQGNNIGIACKVEGKRGHEVWLDVKPSDGDQIINNMGTLRGGGEEIFSNRIYKVTTTTKYRFRAGDAFSPKWYTITPRPPLAFTGLTLEVVPPEYTGLEAKKYDEKSTSIDVPNGSKISVTVNCNSPLVSLTAGCRDGEAEQLKPSSDKTKWEGTMTVTNGSALKLVATSSYGDKLEAAHAYNLLPDRPPAIVITAPKEGATLAPGMAPAINFDVTDDYGLNEITIQRMSSASSKDTKGEVIKTYRWANSRTMNFTSIWNGTPTKPTETGQIIFRVVAKDNCPGNPRINMSAPIVFNSLNAEQVAKKTDTLQKKVFADLSKVIDLQKENVAKTKMYQGILKDATAENWGETSDRQKEIREITKQLLARGGNCLGNLTAAVQKLYMGEMADAITALEGIAGTKVEEKGAAVDKALVMEEKILRQLTFAEVAVAKAQVEVRMSALSSQLEKLVKDETKVVRTATEYVNTGTGAGSSLATDQDKIASEFTAFRQACMTESGAIVNDDKNYSVFLEEISKMCVDQKVREDMMMAAENLDKNKTKEAVPLAQSARDKLVLILQRFNDVQIQEEKEKKLEMVEALQNVNKKLEKIKELEKKMIEAMEGVKGQKDKDKKDIEKMEEDFKEIDKLAKEALLEVPKDLDIFTELNAGTDMVEDMFTTFEEVQQKLGSDQLGPDGKVASLAPAKREWMLDAMEEAKDRLDELETYLKTAPDALKITTEAFDKEEMPKAGVALVPLLTKTEQIIGDLLNESKQLQEKDNDGAINSATPDMEADGPITEGDVTSYSARGQVGNETPDHKEQDGRSNVGRQGMSTGETAAGGGTIAKGDENIEARRTEDPPQSGQVNADGEADTKATGGGKLGTGKGDAYGQGGGIKRMDSTEAGSMEAMAAMMAKQTDQTYAEASMKNLKADSLKSAAHHMRQAADAVAKGNISQVAEFKRKALADLKKAKTELENNAGGNQIDSDVQKSVVEDVVASSPDDAPPKYKDLVAEYYKKLNEVL